METDNEKDFKEKMKGLGASKNDFKVPEHYFEKLSSRISDNTLVNQKNQSYGWFPRVAIAVCLLVLSIVGYKVWNPTDKNNLNKEQLVANEAVNETEEISEEDLVDAYAFEESDDNNELTEYLIENDINENDIINF